MSRQYWLREGIQRTQFASSLLLPVRVNKGPYNTLLDPLSWRSSIHFFLYLVTDELNVNVKAGFVCLLTHNVLFLTLCSFSQLFS